MFDRLTKIGDEVTVTIPQENREWGYNPCPDGTKATVLSFSEIHYGRLYNFGYKPGVYVNRVSVKVRLPDGKEYYESSSSLELTDKDEYERRLSAFHELHQGRPDSWRNTEFLRELPETPFWEGDFVLARGHSRVTRAYSKMSPDRDPNTFQIIGIDYEHLNERTEAGTKYPAYRISDRLGAGWHTSASEDDMALVERGPVWKFFHNEPITFDGIEDEANFFESLGHTEEVRNPASNLYSWTKEEILKAIKSGLVHGFSMGNGLFSDKPTISARRFKNEDLGRRVAQATLKGFGLALV